MAQAPSNKTIGSLNPFNHSIPLSQFPASWKGAKVAALPKPGKEPKFPQNLHPIILLPFLGKTLKKLFQKLSEDT
jgi:hypothetical protein